MLDDQYQAYARNRMYMSGVDSALADTLATEHGFQLLLPSVYRWRRTDDVFVFRNDNPDPSELIREIIVTWRSPPTSVDTESLLEWRREMVEGYYAQPQDVVPGPAAGGDPSTARAARRCRSRPSGGTRPSMNWPAAGPFITRAVTCDAQDRTYYLDAWLYAPGKEKYEYMIQLQTIMDSFACGA